MAASSAAFRWKKFEKDKVNASFRNGVLTMALCKSARAQRQAKRIAIYTR
jgi:HSP20 family molecular chaperone IbpA